MNIDVDDIIISVFDKRLQVYELMMEPYQVGRMAGMIKSVQVLNSFFILYIDGHQHNWISNDPQIMTDYVIDTICEIHERGRLSSL